MGPVAELELPADRTSPGEARRFVALIDGLSPERRIEAQLIVSELVTNAVLHAGLKPADLIRLRVARQHGGLRIDVDDTGTFTADCDTFAYSREDHRNRGLRIVQLVATRWEANHGRVRAWLKLYGSNIRWPTREHLLARRQAESRSPTRALEIHYTGASN